MIISSNIFGIKDNLVIGLLLRTLFLLPDFKMGVIKDFSYSLGKILKLSERLNKKCNGLTRECLQNFKNKGSIPFGSIPECSFKESIISKISISEIFQELILRL